MLSEGMYYYSYELYDIYIPKVDIDLRNRNVYLYDLEGKFIKEISTKELKKIYNIHTYKEIYNIINNKSSIHGN
ncbi:MAG: hypothetical protein ACI3VR_02215 [Intestinibacter sp.]|uniref:hypothetical protein n=1 Tax=Intestinibacter sp. TaxID=1965304 RepID=UPI003F166FC8